MQYWRENCTLKDTREREREREKTDAMGRMTWNFTIDKDLDISEIYAKSVVKQEYE